MCSFPAHIISTGQTLVAATATLKQAGMAAPLCIGVHALFDGGALQRLQDAGVTRVVTCDTIPHASNAICLAPVLPRTVRTISSTVTQGDPS